MKIYIDYILIGIKEHMVYPSAIWARFLSRLLYLYLQFSIWNALFLSNSQTNLILNQEDTLKYIVVATIVSSFMECNTTEWINTQIQSGNIVTELIRPIDFRKMVFSRHLGDTLGKNCVLLYSSKYYCNGYYAHTYIVSHTIFFGSTFNYIGLLYSILVFSYHRIIIILAHCNMASEYVFGSSI